MKSAEAEAKMEALRAWCREAEASGIAALAAVLRAPEGLLAVADAAAERSAILAPTPVAAGGGISPAATA